MKIDIKFVQNLLGNKKIKLPKDPGDPELYYKVLDDYENQLNKDKKYLEAEYVKNIKQQCKQMVEKGINIELFQLQNQEQKFIKKSIKQEFKGFNNFWNKKIKEFNDQCNNLLQSLIEKQKQDFEEIKLQLIENMPHQYKESRELVQMRQQERFLSKNKNYIEAHYALEKIKQLELIDQEKFKNDIQQQIFLKLEQVRNKQQQELEILIEKIDQAKQEQEVSKQIDQQKLMKKFENMKSQLQLQHKFQQNKLEKTFINQQLNDNNLNQSKLILNNQNSLISPEKSRLKL